MTLHERPLDRLEYNGRVYRLSLSFDRVFRLMEIFDDPHIFQVDKLRAAVRLLVKGRAPVGILEPLFKAIFGESHKTGSTRAFDFRQDANYIYAAFRQAYGIDLHRERGRLHWHEFVALFTALPEDTRMAQIMAIRNRPLPKPNGHNADEIQAIMRQKRAVALDAPQETKKQTLEDGLRMMADRLMALANGS